MPGLKPPAIKLTPTLQKVLEKIARCYTNPYWLVLRAKIILIAATDANNTEVARRLDIDPDTARKWRTRWLAAEAHLRTAEANGLTEKGLAALVEAVLADAPRPGASDTFTPQQLVRIVALACEDPGESGREITQWTPRELADEAIKREIVTTISTRQVGRILDNADLKPHKSRYWLHADPKDPDIFAEEVEKVCNLYAQASDLHQQDVSIVGTDEKTGIPVCPDGQASPRAETSDQAYEARPC